MQAAKHFLDERGLKYEDFGTYSAESCDYSDFALPACHAIASGTCSVGLLICGTGIGMSIAANKIPGIRAGLCTNNFMAEMTRAHNDANVLCLGARVTSETEALGIIDVFFSTDFEGGRHSRRVEKLNALDSERE